MTSSWSPWQPPTATPPTLPRRTGSTPAGATPTSGSVTARTSASAPPLARMEGRIAFSVLLERFPSLSLAVAPEALRWREGPFLRGFEALPVRLDGEGSDRATGRPLRPAPGREAWQ